jgi:exodeoxyribonuclease VII large subunit
MKDENPRKFSVSELNRSAKQLLEMQFNQVWVEGELSNMSQPSSGHWYFTLKDSGAQIKCAMFRNRNIMLKLRPKHGDKVLVRGKISLYEARGDYQLIIENLQAIGEGALQQQFEQLKNRLQGMGLFNPGAKQPIPSHPTKIGIITSASGAALRDILQVLNRRAPNISVSVIPCLVQGNEASEQIMQSIHRAERAGLFDCLILARGGGSLEDLWAFNNEALAHTIHQCSVPIISAVGHETDFTIADYAADLRAPTPSAAAELASPDNSKTLKQLKQIRESLNTHIKNYLSHQQKDLAILRSQLVHPGDTIKQFAQSLDLLEYRLIRAVQARITLETSRTQKLQARINTASPQKAIEQQKNHLNSLKLNLVKALKQDLKNKQIKLQHTATALDIVSPLATLKRGYCIIKDETNAIIKTRKQLQDNDKVELHFQDGSTSAIIKI